MPRATCTHCHDHPAALPGQLCRACTCQVTRDLRDLPEWHTALLERPRRAAGQRVAGGDAHAPAPAAGPALDHRATIRGTLWAWTRYLEHAHQVAPPPVLVDTDALVVSLVAHLTDHLGTLLAGDLAADLAASLSHLVTRASAIAAPDRPSTVPIGRCPCGGVVIADTGAPANHRVQPLDLVEAWCTHCHDRGVLRWWQTRLPAAAEWLPVSRLRMHLLVAHGLHVSDAQLWQWVHRGHVQVSGEGRRALYRVADALNRAQGVPIQRGAVHTVSEPA